MQAECWRLKSEVTLNNLTYSPIRDLLLRWVKSAPATPNTDHIYVQTDDIVDVTAGGKYAYRCALKSHL
jgi:hypothetical protein